MTRIIAGTAKGRRLRVPPRGTRPTSERVREALFSMLQARIDWEDSRVLDLYSGSGALGIEAASRGAASVTLVERHPAAVRIIRENLAAVPSAQVRVVGSAASAWCAAPAPAAAEVVFLDPPYDLDTGELGELLRVAAANGHLAEGAYVLVERAVRSRELSWGEGFEAQKSRRHGDTRVEWARYLAPVPAAPGPALR